MSMGPVLATVPRLTALKLWKSWITHRQQLPAGVLHVAEFKHMLPTTSTLAAQAALRALQGNAGIWFAGGYLFPFDSQETALLSSLLVAAGLNVTSTRTRALQLAGRQ
jgi:predicted NAD/FAD-binding protein